MRRGRRARPVGSVGLAVLLTATLGPLGAEGGAQERRPESPQEQARRKIPSHPSRLEFPTREVEIPRAEPLTHRLSNGTPVVIVEDHSLPLVDLTVAVLAGSYLDPADKPGLAELTGAMLRRGGTRAHPPAAFDEAVDVLGGEIDSRATGTRAGASLDCLAENFEDCLALFFEMLRQPAFDAERLSGIRTSLRAGFAARNDDPIGLMESEWSRLLVGDAHYLGRHLTIADVDSLTRRDLESFHASHWRPERAVIAVSGAVATARVLELLETEVARWRDAVGSTEDAPTPWPPEAEAVGSSAGIYLVGHASDQAKISMGQGIRPIPQWLSRDALALEVANEILGGTTGLVSRINGRLRGQGWVYRALSELDTGVYEPGSFRIFLDASPDNITRALQVCLEEIDRLVDAPVDPRELAIVKEEFLSALALRFDTAEEIAGYFAEDLLLGRPHDYWYGYVERLQSLTPSDLQTAAARHLDPHSLQILIVGGGEAATKQGARHQTLKRWLKKPIQLPPRDPLTLEPLPPPSNTPDPG